MADTTFVNGHYLSRSWRMMTQDKGWLAPVCIMALAMFVPIVGALGVSGYALSWARLTAWGVDAAPKQRGVRVGECIGAGWRAFVVSLVWGIVAGLVTAMLGWLLGYGGPSGSVISNILAAIIDIMVSMMVFVANLRVCIYQKISAGFGISQIWTMVTRNVGGLVRIWGICLLGGLVMALPILAVYLAMIPTFVSLFLTAYYSVAVDSAALFFGALAATLQSAILPLLLAGFVINLIWVVVLLLVYTSGGLWIRQFDVPRWGGPSDPVPTPLTPDPLPAPVAPVPQEAPQAQQPFVAQPAPTSTPSPTPLDVPADPSAEKPAAQPPAAPAPLETPAPAETEPAAQPIELVLSGEPGEARASWDPEPQEFEASDEDAGEGNDEESAPVPPTAVLGQPQVSDDKDEIVTPLIVHQDTEDQ